MASTCATHWRGSYLRRPQRTSSGLHCQGSLNGCCFRRPGSRLDQDLLLWSSQPILSAMGHGHREYQQWKAQRQDPCFTSCWRIPPPCRDCQFISCYILLLMSHRIPTLQIALHVASSYPGAQFYIGCAQVKITGGGSASPPKISIPGTYKGSDPGITVNIYNNLQSYTAPGGAVWSG